MASLSLNESAIAMRGQLLGLDGLWSGVCTDSRAVAPGQLFFALSGEHFDGHDFVDAVLAAGAVAVVVERAMAGAGSQIVVDDSRLALGRLAAAWRQRFPIPMLAITGSNGKTTVKEMVTAIAQAAVGAARVHATQGNFNNEIGLPLTLLRLNELHACAVLEMGMNHPGELRYLSGLAQPTVALINNAQAAHLQGLGSVAAVATAKGELYEGLAANGMGILNADDVHAPLWRSLLGSRNRLEFGLAQGDVRADWQAQGQGSAITLHTPQGSLSLQLPAPGEHNVRNACAATAAALALGFDLDAVRAGLEGFAGVKGRLQRKAGFQGAQIIDDSYNANPGSVQAAIAVLRAEAGTRLLVLGDIGELGDDSLRLHRELGEIARAAGLDGLFTLGEHMRAAHEAYGAGAQHAHSAEELVELIRPQLAAGVTVLVKGSRFMKMERVVAGLLATEGDGTCC